MLLTTIATILTGSSIATPASGPLNTIPLPQPITTQNQSYVVSVVNFNFTLRTQGMVRARISTGSTYSPTTTAPDGCTSAYRIRVINLGNTGSTVWLHQSDMSVGNTFGRTRTGGDVQTQPYYIWQYHSPGKILPRGSYSLILELVSTRLRDPSNAPIQSTLYKAEVDYQEDGPV